MSLIVAAAVAVALPFYLVGTRMYAERADDVIELVSPANGTFVDGQVELRAVVSDYVSVEAVKFFVDGVELAWDDSAPYSTTWRSPAADSNIHRVLAKAKLASGRWTASRSNAVLLGSPPRDAFLNAGDDAEVLAAAGDIACVPGNQPTNTTCHHPFTATLVEAIDPSAVLMLGDAQYEEGILSNLRRAYDPTWGRFKDRTWAAPGGSHDLYGGGDWYEYFGDRAGPAPYRPYSVEVGAWHVVVLNSNCDHETSGGCGEGSAQLAWLRRDLAASTAACTIAVMHSPRWSSGTRHGDDLATAPLVEALYESGVELILSGHDHHYERFAAQDPQGVPDEERGIVQFVVGTGGKWLEEQLDASDNSLVRSHESFGVLKLVLEADRYRFAFIGEPGDQFSDSGRRSCHD